MKLRSSSSHERPTLTRADAETSTPRTAFVMTRRETHVRWVAWDVPTSSIAVDFTRTPAFSTVATSAHAKIAAGAMWFAVTSRKPFSSGCWKLTALTSGQCPTSCPWLEPCYPSLIPFVGHKYSRSKPLVEPVVAVPLYELFHLGTGQPHVRSRAELSERFLDPARRDSCRNRR